jgi:CheY-like chemotaxis protein
MTVKVLTVDDSKTIRMIVKKALKQFDCELFEAENGVEGLSAAAKVHPDLIVLDITMPVMTGIEMLEKLKEDSVLKDIPVIMLTAESGKDNVMQIVKMGVKDYIVKPFKGEQLVERARKNVNLEVRKGEETSTMDDSKKYFTKDGDVEIFSIPAKITRTVIAQTDGFLLPKLKDIAQSGNSKLVLDLTMAEEVNMSFIKLILLIIQGCKKSNVYIRLAGTASVMEGLKGFAETSECTVYPSVAAAKGAF